VALLFLPGLLIGVSNNGNGGDGGSGSMMQECSSFAGAGTETAGCVSSVPVWTEDVTTATAPLAPLRHDSPTVLEPVPADVTVLRVEVVSTSDSTSSRGDSPTRALETRIDTMAGGVPIDSWDQGTPHALDVHLGLRPTDLQVSVTVTSGSGTVQCRIYAGSTLVAIDTSTTTAMCSPAL